MSTCSICCEKVNKSTRKEVECMYCQYTSCRTCCETYILSEPTAKCMNSNCGREWTRKFLSDTFPASFISGPLKKHRENIIFDRERALLPATQPYAEAFTRENALKAEYNEINQIIHQLKTKKRRIQFLLNRLQRNPLDDLDQGDFESANSEEKTRRQFIKPCPVDDCRGFLSSQYKCGLCETWTCPDCNVIIGKSKTTPHTCDPNDVESVKLMKVETKPCPKCAVPIFKIDGCDQIWCTQCHIAFSFKTGNIEKKIHNPHYYEWLRKTQGNVPRDPLDTPCQQDVILHNRVAASFSRIFERQRTGIELEDASKISKLSILVNRYIRNIIHLEEVTIHAIQPQNYEQKNRDLRIRYLTKDIDEMKFKSLLQQAEKKNSKNTEVHDVYRLVVRAATDIIMRYHDFLMKNPNSRDTSIIEELDGLHNYANECLFNIEKTYGNSIHLFSTLFTLK